MHEERVAWFEAVTSSHIDDKLKAKLSPFETAINDDQDPECDMPGCNSISFVLI